MRLRETTFAVAIAIAIAGFFAQPAAAGLWFRPVDGPAGADVNALAADGATLWGATYRGVWKLSAGAWTLDGLGDRTVTSVAVSDGAVFAATGDAVFRRGVDGSWSAETLPSANALPTVLAADGATLYAGGLGVFRRSGGTWSALPSPGPGLVTAMTPDPGGLLVGLSSSLVARWSGAAFTAVGTTFAAAEPVQAVLVNGATILAGTNRGLYAWSGASWAPDTSFGLHDVRALTNAGGTPRAATWDAGVLAQSGSAWGNDRAGLLTYRAKSFAALGSDLYLGTGGGPVYRRSGSSWSAEGTGLNGAEITDVSWPAIASRGGGILLDGAAPLPDGCGDVSAIAPAPNGTDLVVAAGCGPLLGRTSFAAASSGLPAGAAVATLTATPSGVAGGTTNAGVQRFTGSGWSADNNGLSGSAAVGPIRQVGTGLFAFVAGRVHQRGASGVWDDVNAGIPAGATVISFGGSSSLFAGLASGGVYRRDGGSDFHADSAGLLTRTAFSLDDAGGRLFAAAGTGGVLAKSEGGFRVDAFGLPAGADVRVVRGASEPGTPLHAGDLPPGYRLTILAGTMGRGTFRAVSESLVRTVPVVLDVVGGTGARFRTELTIRAGAGPLQVQFVPAPGFSGGTAAQTASVSLPRPVELRVADALEWLRSLGMTIPSASSSVPIAGTLSFTANDVAAHFARSVDSLYAIARTYTTGPSGGTFGLFYDAPSDVDAAEESAAVYGLRSVPGASRSNLALVHVPGRSADPITLSVQVYDASGNAAGAPFARTLAPGEWNQINGILDAAGLPAGSFGYAKITRTSGIGPWIAYGVVNDAATSDGSYLSMQRPGGLGAVRRQIVPVVLDLFGAAGSHYTTELTLVNDGPIATPVDLTYHPAPGFGTVPGVPMITVTVPARGQATLADALQAFRDRGVAVPSASQGGTAGTLTAEFRYLTNIDIGTTLALARTTTPNTDAATGGSFGLFYPAVAVGGGARTSATVPALRQDAAARSNLAVVNTGGGSDGAVTLSVQLYDAATGSAVGSALTATLQPYEWKQWSQVLPLAGVPASVTSAYAVVTRTSGDDAFFTYGVVNDAVTSDGSYVAGIPAERY